MTRRTSALASGGTRARARINRGVVTVVPGVRLIANSGEECRPASVASALSQGPRWTKKPTAGAPASSAADVKVALARRREQRGAWWQRRSLHAHAPYCSVWRRIWRLAEGRAATRLREVRTRSASQSAVHGGCGSTKSVPSHDSYKKRKG